MTNSPLLASGVAILLAYLIGAIPFGFLIFYQVKGIDIRTVGSGNIGATNVGRNLGFRYFLLVFFLDMLKGFLPTLLIPPGVHAWCGAAPADLPVFVALASILGHNFPVYLNFKGGKGVATSFGAILALDAWATGGAFLGFALCFLLTRYVSLSSIAGAIAFVAVHFARAQDPWSPQERGMSILAIVLLILLVVRHRKNIGRILNGMEPKIMLSKKRAGSKDKDQPSGRIVTTLLLLLIPISAFLVGTIWVVRNALATVEIRAGAWTFRETDRVSTGLQRVERIRFSDDGDYLAVTCPRYQKLVIYRLTTAAKLERIVEVALEGRPVGLAAGQDRFLVLQRPPGDRCHLEPGWFEVIDPAGKRIGSRIPTGDYPDDLALAPDRCTLYVVNSGRGEGGAQKPSPKLVAFQTSPKLDSFIPGNQFEFKADEDPARLQLSEQGSCAVVTLHGKSLAPSFDLADPEKIRLIGESQLPNSKTPELSNSEATGDSILLPVETESEGVPMDLYGRGKERAYPPFLACTQPENASVEISQPTSRRVIARIPLRGRLNLGGTQPSGIAYSARKNYLAVATRYGAIHLIAIDSRLDD